MRVRIALLALLVAQLAAGATLNEAKTALDLALDRLDEQDRFNIIQSNPVTISLFIDAQPATPGAIAQAKHWVQALPASGGTVTLVVRARS
jgi:Ca-activated chloride channel family protein